MVVVGVFVMCCDGDGAGEGMYIEEGGRKRERERERERERASERRSERSAEKGLSE